MPSGPIYAVDQVFADPQVQHIGASAPVDHPTLGTIRLVNQAARLSRTPAAMAMAPPELGEHTEEILHELGFGSGEIAALRERKVI